jgi:hypothetical protein
MSIYLILLSILVVVGGVYFVSKYKIPIQMITNDQNHKILETRDFSCTGMEGFAFKYPVFKGWKVEGVSRVEQTMGINETCSIDFDGQPYKDSFKVLITKINHPTSVGPGLYTDNPVSVSKLGDGYRFESKEFSVDIQPNNTPDGFPSGQFFKTVVETFKIIEPRILEIAGEVAQQHSVNLSEYQTPSVEYDSENKKWLVFYVRKPPTPPGGHFSVSVDDTTGKAEFQPGE